LFKEPIKNLKRILRFKADSYKIDFFLKIYNDFIFSDTITMSSNELLYFISGLLGGFFLRHFIYDFLRLEEPEPIFNESPIPEELDKPKGPDFSEIDIRKKFKASRLGDPVTPDEVIFNNKGITFNVKTLFASTESFVLYSDISGVEIVESLILATIKVKPKIRSEIKIDNFTKKDATIIKNLILDRLN
jgi:hypothetical protein